MGDGGAGRSQDLLQWCRWQMKGAWTKTEFMTKVTTS
jgi:hypothetical protein